MFQAICVVSVKAVSTQRWRIPGLHHGATKARADGVPAPGWRQELSRSPTGRNRPSAASALGIAGIGNDGFFNVEKPGNGWEWLVFQRKHDEEAGGLL